MISCCHCHLQNMLCLKEIHTNISLTCFKHHCILSQYEEIMSGLCFDQNFLLWDIYSLFSSYVESIPTSRITLELFLKGYNDSIPERCPHVVVGRIPLWQQAGAKGRSGWGGIKGWHKVLLFLFCKAPQRLKDILQIPFSQHSCLITHK